MGSSSLEIHSEVETTSTPSTPSSPKLAGRAKHPHPDPVCGSEPRPLGKRAESLLRPEAIEGNGHAPPGGHHSWESEGAAGASVTLWEITSRPA